jgi:hypothetical protein
MGYPQDMLEVLGVVHPVFAFLPPGLYDTITHFPDPEGMRPDPAKVLYVPDREVIHLMPDKYRSPRPNGEGIC